MKRAMWVLALLLATGTASALTQDAAETILSQVGYKGTVSYREDSVNRSGWNALTDSIDVRIQPTIPDKGAIYVLLHEAAHEQQAREGRLLPTEPTPVPLVRHILLEWDADVRALTMGCRFGITKNDFLDYWRYRASFDGYGGDPLHGRLDDRVAYAMDHAPDCS